MDTFKPFGLSHYESKAFETILQGKITAKQLSKKAGIPFGKIYSVINSLLKQSIIEETDDRPKTYFVSEPAKAVGQLIEKKEKEDEILLNRARSIAIKAEAASKGRSDFFELGINQEDNRKIQLRSFVEAKKEVCQIINIHHKPFINRAIKLTWEKEIQNAIKRGVTFRCIYPANVEIPSLLQKLPKDKFQVRRLDTNFSRCDVIDRKKVCIKLMHQDAMSFGGIIFLENEKFAKNLQAIFETFWNEAE